MHDGGSGSPDAVLPLFPLGHVLMPGLPLPLRIFEPRYRRLLKDITAEGGSGRFGVVALTAGLEVDNGLDDGVPRYASVGTVAEILEVHPLDDGTVHVLAGGSQRFRIRRTIDAAVPYLQAEVDYLGEHEGSMAATLPAATRALAGEYARLLHELIEPDPGPDPDYPDDVILLSYRLATETPLPPPEHQLLLEDETAAARLLHVQRVLRREVVLLRRTRSIAVPPGRFQIAIRPN